VESDGPGTGVANRSNGESMAFGYLGTSTLVVYVRELYSLH
jgi:hypothetical protein